MTKTFCDACGKEVEKDAKLELHTRCEGSDNKTRHLHMDLCNACLDKVIAFADSLKKVS